jgi:hypothetical protein
MPSIVITFDVSDKHLEIRDHLAKLGYLDRWFYENNMYMLPNCSLWKTDITPDQAINEITMVASKMEVRLIRAISVLSSPSSPWAGIESK